MIKKISSSSRCILHCVRKATILRIAIKGDDGTLRRFTQLKLQYPQPTTAMAAGSGVFSSQNRRRRSIVAFAALEMVKLTGMPLTFDISASQLSSGIVAKAAAELGEQRLRCSWLAQEEAALIGEVDNLALEVSVVLLKDEEEDLYS